MASRLRHRGPDDEGMFVDKRVGLAHRRLSIIDLATGHQPMTVGHVTVAFNGEIYNYVELRDTLLKLGHEFRTTSDTEVLLRMYLEHGTQFVTRMNGMFAFVLYDARLQLVIAARDHFGIKPLYVHEGRERVMYASEIKALVAHHEVARMVDRHGLDEYLTLQYTLGSRTLFKGIRKLLPAHIEILELESGRVRSERYWKPRFDIEARKSEKEFVAELRELLRGSVRQQMRSDVPVGAYLSGGLDSSTVAMLAARETSETLQTFTGAFRAGPEYDESRYALMVAEACGAEPLVVYPTEEEFVDLLPSLAYQMDEPAAGPGLFPQFVVSRLAASHVKVCLGGQGGDEIFGGYARYVIGYFERALSEAIFGDGSEEDLGIPLEAMAGGLSQVRQYAPMMARFLRSGVFESVDRRYFALMDRSEGLLDAYSADFRAQYDRDAVFDRFKAVFDESDTPSFYNRMLYYDMLTSLPALLQVEDRVSMAVSLESRVPLLDYRIVDLVAGVPPRVKFRNGEMKYLFKQAIADLLPPAILGRRDKMGFPVPVQTWARRGRAREFFQDVLLSQRARQRGLFDPSAVERLIDGETAFSRVLWGMLQLELWYRCFIDGDGAPV